MIKTNIVVRSYSPSFGDAETGACPEAEGQLLKMISDLGSVTEHVSRK